MRILVFGATGMLGHMVFGECSRVDGWQVTATQSQDPAGRHYFNAIDTPEIPFEYDYAVNCIGIRPGSIDAHDPVSVARAIEVNALFPHRLAADASRKGARVIHISTDGVYGGQGAPYSEDCAHDPGDIYGKTKSLGESRSANLLVMRTSVIGPSPFKREGLLEWFLGQPDGGIVRGFVNHHWHGFTTLQFAKLCVRIIGQGAFDRLRSMTYSYNLASGDPISKHDLLVLFNRVFDRNVIIEAAQDPHGKVDRALCSKFTHTDGIFAMDTIAESLTQLARAMAASPG